MRQTFCAVAAMVLGSLSLHAAGIPAFPGAQGPGSRASGGRGGDVYHVTTLDDDADKPGSFRYGIKTVPAAGRTIVFDVAGVIRLQPPGRKGWLDIGASNLTIAGQTAPYPGITITGQATKMTGSNVILRNIKFRPGKDQLKPEIATNDGITSYLKNSIIDHCTASWYDDEAISVTDDAENTTVQYCLLSEGLNYKGHSYGCLISSDHDDAKVSYHHNLFAHNKSRLPRLGSEKGSGVILNFSNNVIYDWQGRAGYSANDMNSKKPLPNRTNFIRNYYISGPSNGANDEAFNGANDVTEIYQQGNLLDTNKNDRFDGADEGWAFFSGTYSRREAPFDVDAGAVVPAERALADVIAHAGAFWWQRDPIDVRVIEQVRAQQGRMINDPSDVGGLPAFKLAERPADFDSDRDGMPDVWEEANGFNAAAADDQGDADGDGYTNLEEFLNEVAAFPSPTPIEPAGDGGNWAVPATWANEWQPSALDEVRLVRGDIVVNSPAQRAGELNVGQAALRFTSGRLDVTNDASFKPDSQLILAGGDLRVGGNLSIAAARVRIELEAGTPTGSVSAAGTLTVGGWLDVVSAGKAPPTPGARYKIAGGKTITGAFEGVSRGFTLEQQGTDIFLVVDKK